MAGELTTPAEPGLAQPGAFTPGQVLTQKAVSSADSAHARDGAYGFGGDWGHAAESASATPASTTPVIPAVIRQVPAPRNPAPRALPSRLLAPGAVRVSSADTGHGAEAASVRAALSGTDSASGTEGFPRIRVASADAATAAESSGVAAWIPPVLIRALQRWIPQAAPRPPASAVLPVMRAPVLLASADSGHAAEAASIHAALSGADSGHAAEAASLQVTLAGADTGHAAEAASIHAALSGPDTGHAAEAGSIHAALSSADSGHAAEAAAVAGWIPPVVIRARTPDAPSRRVPPSSAVLPVARTSGAISSADSGHAAEAGSVHAALSAADSGHAAEGTPAIRVASADAASGAEGVPRIRTAAADAGSGTEAGSVHAAIHAADTAIGSESGKIAAALPGADSGHAAEAASIHAAVPSADAGHAAEAGSVHATLSSADTGHAAEAASVHAAIPAADSAIGSESGKIAAALPGADSGHAAEAASVHAALSSADTATAAELGSTGHTVHGTDAALAVESAFYYILAADAAAAAEGAAALRVAGKDAASAADRPLNSWPHSADASGGTAGKPAAERAYWSGPLASADSGHAAEGWRPFRFALADSATAVEVLHEMGIWTYIPVNVRLLMRYWRVTGRDEQGNEVVLLEAEQLDRSVLELAERMRTARIRLVSSADSGRTAEASRPVTGVTCHAGPAVAVRVTAIPAVSVTVTVTAEGGGSHGAR